MLDQIEKPSDLVLHVGDRMRKWRKERGLTLAEVGARCNTTPQTIQRLETGGMTLSVEWVERISKVLGVKPHVLFMRDADDDTLLEKTEARLRKVELGFQMLRTAVDTICRDHLGERGHEDRGPDHHRAARAETQPHPQAPRGPAADCQRTAVQGNCP